MPDYPYPGMNVQMMRMFTRDVVDAGGQVLRRLNCWSDDAIQDRTLILDVALEQLREAASHVN